MNLLSADSLGKHYGERTLFSGLSFGLAKGDKSALIAANGTGKSSLLKILSNIEPPDEGEVAVHEGTRIGYLEQEPAFDPKLTVGELITKADISVRSIIRNYDQALNFQSVNHTPEAEKALTRATAQMDQADAWDFDRRLIQMLDRFGITQLEQKIETLSGGQRKRLALALLLLDNPDLLLLDEPTNHLDIAMIEWLEDYLSTSSVTFLMVTHDRYFLDRICNHILELDNAGLYTYDGNYEYFLEKKAERTAAAQAESDRTDKFVKRELDWIRRMPKARGTKSKSRIDAFNQAREKAKTKNEQSTLNLGVKQRRVGGKILEITNLSKKFGHLTILHNFSYNFTKGEKIGIIGPNGSGKSTFLNLITGRDRPDGGSIVTGETIVYGYYSQDGIRVNENKRVIDVVKDIAEVIEAADGSVLSASQFLQFFLFPPEKQYDYVSKLSGGEKRRLYLLTVLVRNPNFLILDEPTNDLDIITLSKMEEFLSAFRGCLILVSHDRYLLDKMTDHMFVFEGDGSIVNYYGSYSQYKIEKEEEQLLQRKENTLSRIGEEKKDESRPVPPAKKKLSFKEKREHELLEKDINKLETEKKELEALLNSGENDYEKLENASARIGQIIALLDEKTMRWLELDEMN
ncbi:MAG TPA: ABC-F family ATP-binding cassette domain-containing protein [Bacteroidales bacterium]|nr:ABC-F family ATP-binding cassette domain-containing protein [Bacteroidales bacterium]